MMITESRIQQLVEEKVADSDIFIVSIKVLPGNRIRVFVDAVQGLTVEACVSISRHIEGSLDREREDFELEVSSPGLLEPYVHPLQYRKNVGRTVRVVSVNGAEMKGKLIGFDGSNITVEPERAKKGKKTEVETVTLPLDQIKEAKTVISFK
jgi:ribosome maturation factor RimP